MPEALNLEWQLAKLRAEIASGTARGVSTEALEACLSLGQTLAARMKPAISHAEMTQPPERD